MTDFNEFEYQVGALRLDTESLGKTDSYIVHRFLLNAVRDRTVALFAKATGAHSQVFSEFRPDNPVSGGDFYIEDNTLVIQPSSHNYKTTPQGAAEQIGNIIAQAVRELEISVQDVVVLDPKIHEYHPFWTEGKVGSTL